MRTALKVLLAQSMVWEHPRNLSRASLTIIDVNLHPMSEEFEWSDSMESFWFGGKAKRCLGQNRS